MQNEQKQKTVIKTLRLEESLVEEIEKLAKENERDFTKQIKFMLKKYLETNK